MPIQRGKNIETVREAIEIVADKEKGTVTVVLDLEKHQKDRKIATLGLKFNDPEELLKYMTKLFEAGAEVWPDNEFLHDFEPDKE